METKSRFSLAVKRDCVTLKIYRVGDPAKYVNYMVGFREGGKRVPQTYASLETAKVEAAAIAERLADGSGDTVTT